MKQDILKIIDELFTLQESKKAEVFISFCGHVSELRVTIYAPSYNKNFKPILEARIYTDSTNKKGLNEFVRKINTITDLLIKPELIN